MTHEIVQGEPPYVLIKWNPPINPNGLIILYEVFYKKVGDSEVSMNHWAWEMLVGGLAVLCLSKLKGTEVMWENSQQK